AWSPGPRRQGRQTLRLQAGEVPCNNRASTARRRGRPALTLSPGPSSNLGSQQSGDRQKPRPAHPFRTSRAAMTNPLMWKERIKADFHLGIVMLFSTITILVVVPFSIRRFLVDEPVAGTLGLLIMACIASGAAHCWRTGRTAGASNCIAAMSCVCCVGIAREVQPSGVLWVFPVLVANFLLVSRVRALLLSSVVIAGVLIGDDDLATAVDQLTFLATALMVSLFSFVFASRTEIQRARLQAAALRGPLTGAGNRRGLDAELDIAMAASTRSGEPLGFLVFDIDLFKRVNDSLGHEAGDQVLRAIAALVQARTRAQERFYRMGGEERALLLP